MPDFFKKISQKVEKAVDKTEDVISGPEGFEERRKKSFYQQWPFWVIIAFVIVIFGFAMIYVSYWNPLKNSMALAQQTQSYFEKVQKDLLSANFDQAKKDIESAQISLEKLDKNVSQLNSPLIVGYLRTQYNAVDEFISATKQFSDGLYLLTDLTQNILANASSDQGNLTISSVQRKQILEKFSRQAPELNSAKAQIDLSLLTLSQIETGKLNSKLAEYVINLKIKLILLRDFLNKAVGLAESAPSLLGLNQEKTYLFLLQNNNELRPTGGFIGTVGIVKIKDGQITFFDTQNVYDYDKNVIGKLKVAAPAPIKKYLNVDYWYLRDSNWSPDFIEATKKIEWFYHNEAQLSNGALKDYPLDGVIAITPKVIEEFLAVIGAVEINSFVFDKNNFVDRLQYLVEVGYQDQNVEFFQRKNIIGDLSKKLIDRTERMSLSGWVEILKSLFNNLNQKHILVNIKNPVIQNLIAEQNWSNEIKKYDDDYLQVVDANLASLKSNQCVTREIKYNLIPRDKKLVAKVDILYKNICSFTWKSTRYRTYTRIYIPLGSKLLKTTGVMDMDRSTKSGETDVYDENGKTVFGAFISIEPKQTGTLSFEYELPDNLSAKIISTGEYNLYLQKQAGTLKDKLIVNLTLPKEIKITLPSEPRVNWGDNKYQLTTDLEVDREVKIEF